MQISKAICMTGMEMSHESWFWDAFHCPTEERNSKQSQRKQAIVKNCWSTKVLLVRNQCYQNVHLFTKVLQLKDYAHAGFSLSLPGYLPAASIYENIGWFQWLLPHCSFQTMNYLGFYLWGMHCAAGTAWLPKWLLLMTWCWFYWHWKENSSISRDCI